MTDSLDTILESSELIVIGNKAPEFSAVLPRLREEQMLIDLVRMEDVNLPSNGHYQGICW
jgi:GDP-mannose 6-dehydrogenase